MLDSYASYAQEISSSYIRPVVVANLCFLTTGLLVLPLPSPLHFGEGADHFASGTEASPAFTIALGTNLNRSSAIRTIISPSKSDDEKYDQSKDAQGGHH